MNKIGMYLSVIMLSLTTFLSAQVKISNAFKETIQKIIKENIKEGVVDWLTDKEQVIGVTGGDLIGLVINSAFGTNS